MKRDLIDIGDQLEYDNRILTSWDFDDWATNPPPWKWMISPGEGGLSDPFNT